MAFVSWGAVWVLLDVEVAGKGARKTSGKRQGPSSAEAYKSGSPSLQGASASASASEPHTSPVKRQDPGGAVLASDGKLTSDGCGSGNDSSGGSDQACSHTQTILGELMPREVPSLAHARGGFSAHARDVGV